MINEEIKHNNELCMEEQEAMDILINIKIGYDKSRLGFAEYQLNILISEYERLKEIRDDIQSKFFLLFETLNEYEISNDTIDAHEWQKIRDVEEANWNDELGILSDFKYQINGLLKQLNDGTIEQMINDV